MNRTSYFLASNPVKSWSISRVCPPDPRTPRVFTTNMTKIIKTISTSFSKVYREFQNKN